MQWIEVSVPTRSDEIDDVCAQLAELGAGGMVVEDETDFQQFLEQNHQYWDYVDDALEAQFRGVSRIKFYLADDDDGRAQLAAIRAGIGALLLGCAHVTGCDIDPKAPEVAAANAALNGFYEDKFTVCAGDILADAGLRRRLGTGYDIVLANIVADVIIPLAALAPAFLAPGGTFVCSGIIDGREDEVAAALARAGFTVTAHDTLEEWHCFTATLA